MIIELGQPEQLPFNSTLTVPFLKDTNLISPPSFETAGLILVSSTSFICFTISSSFSLFSDFLERVISISPSKIFKDVLKRFYSNVRSSVIKILGK